MIEKEIAQLELEIFAIKIEINSNYHNITPSTFKKMVDKRLNLKKKLYLIKKADLLKKERKEKLKKLNNE